MRIIKGNASKDYYDYLQGILGQDNLVVYDRRECTPIDPNSFIENQNLRMWFSNKPTPQDKKKYEKKLWNKTKLKPYNVSEEEWKAYKWKKTKIEGDLYHFILEIGYHHYLFEAERYIDDSEDDKLHLDYNLIDSKGINRDDKLSKSPICLCPTSEGWGIIQSLKPKKDEIIENPILSLTYIPKFIDAKEIWYNVYEYLSSLNDKEIVDSRTNEEHIESNGFDKKTSFRNIKNKGGKRI